MRSSKKALFMLLLIFSMVTVMAACGKAKVETPSETAAPATAAPTTAPTTEPTAAPKEIVSLTLTIHGSWITGSPGYQAVIDLVNSKSAELGAKIEVEKIAEGDPGDQLIYTRFAAGEVPDILSFYDATFASKLGGADQFEDVTGDWMKDYDDNALNTPKYVSNKKRIVLAFGEVGGLNMFFNKKVLEKAGVAAPPNNWTEFLAACEKIKAVGITPIYYSGKDAWTLQIIPLVGGVRDARENVTQLVDELSTNKKHWVDLPLFIDSIAKLKELVTKGFVNKTYLSDDYASAQQALIDGKAGFYAMGSWVIPDLKKLSAEKVNDIGAMGIPFDEGQLLTTSAPGGLFIPAGGKHKELAKKVAAFMASPEAQAAYYKAQPAIPFIKSGLVIEGLLPAQLDIQKAMADGKAFISPLDFTKYQKGPFEKYLQDLLVGGRTAVQVAEELDKDFKKAAEAANDPNWAK